MKPGFHSAAAQMQARPQFHARPHMPPPNPQMVHQNPAAAGMMGQQPPRHPSPGAAHRPHQYGGGPPRHPHHPHQTAAAISAGGRYPGPIQRPGPTQNRPQRSAGHKSQLNSGAVTKNPGAGPAASANTEPSSSSSKCECPVSIYLYHIS